MGLVPNPVRPEMQERTANEMIVDKDAAHEACREAIIAVNKMSEGSCVLDQDREGAVPRYAREQLVLGSFLGRGGFSDVYEVKKIECLSERRRVTRRSSMPMAISRHTLNDSESVTSSDSHEVEEEETMSRGKLFRRKKAPKVRYAVKFLSLSTMSHPSNFATGAADLAIESHFLASLDHPNIIKLRGVSNGGIEGFSEGRGGGYFLILDRLVETLDVRLDNWHQKQSKSGLFSKKSEDQKVDQLMRSLVVAHAVADAMQYMHECNIIYRDLKPENLGFDINDDVKIFDFGLAKELRAVDLLDDGLYNLTGNTGSPRYMAPEVGSSMPYNLSADVYSFSILLWELFSLEQPFSGMSPTTHSELVIHGPYRPPIDEDWPSSLRMIMEMGWSSDIKKRPKMKIFCVALVREIADMVKGTDSSLSKKPTREFSRSKSFKSRR